MVHAGLDAVVGVLHVIQHLARAAAVAWCERLVPFCVEE